MASDAEANKADLTAGGFRDWTARRRATQDQAMRRSANVRRLRKLLPVSGGALVVALVAAASFERVDTEFLKIFTTLRSASDDLKMMSPRFAGKDDKGRPFEVTAEAATQSPDNENLIELIAPQADISVGTPEEAKVVSKTGEYLSEEKLLKLDGGVELRYGQNEEAYVFRAPSASVSFETNTLSGEEGVVGDGPLGDVKANTFSADEAGEVLTFEGDVKVRIASAGKK
ncbi:MAG: LPS export ABC transporter periplasmic protein LptC [Pseudomonadota bacterium]